MHRTKEQLGLPLIPEPYSERRPGGCGTRRWYMTAALVASLMLGVTTPAAAEVACKPALAFKDVRFFQGAKSAAKMDSKPDPGCFAMRCNPVRD
jgi:hypothetical protein